MEQRRGEFTFFLILLGAVAILSFLILKEYLVVLFLAATLAIVFNPLYKSLLKSLKSQFWASLAATLIVILIILVPLTFFGLQIFREAKQSYFAISTGDSTVFNNAISYIERPLHNFKSEIDINLPQYIRNILSSLIQNLGSIFSGILKIIFDFFLMLFALFFLFRDGGKLKETLMALSPLSDKYNQIIFDKLAAAINSVVRGSLVIAIAQGISTTIGFSIFKIPNPVLWGSATIIAALVPIFGTSLVLVPGVVYLYFTGHGLAALGLAIWALTAVGLIDNLLGPLIIKKTVNINPLLILISVLGAISFFGPIGFLLGPVILTLLITLIEIYLTLKKQAPI